MAAIPPLIAVPIVGERADRARAAAAGAMAAAFLANGAVGTMDDRCHLAPLHACACVPPSWLPPRPSRVRACHRLGHGSFFDAVNEPVATALGCAVDAATRVRAPDPVGYLAAWLVAVRTVEHAAAQPPDDAGTMAPEAASNWW